MIDWIASPLIKTPAPPSEAHKDSYSTRGYLVKLTADCNFVPSGYEQGAVQTDKREGWSFTQSSNRFLTLGHGTLAMDAFLSLVKEAHVQHLVDVRTVPKSRHNPQFGREAMQTWVPAAGLTYRWEAKLGGFRRPRANSKNVALRNAAFRGYADYMQTPQFWHAFEELLSEATAAPTAIMCSESLWWRCHRRLIGDAAVLTRGVEVLDLFHDGRLVAHRVTDGARVQDGLVVYDASSLSYDVSNLSKDRSIVSQPTLLDHPRVSNKRPPDADCPR